MAYMDWDGSLSVGNMMIDDDHRTLVACINDLFDAGIDDKAVVEHVLDVLGTYTVQHFAREEELMGESHFPDLVAHKKEHALLLKLYLDHREKITKGEESRDDVLKFLKMWLLGHIKQSDIKLAGHLRDHPPAPVEAAVTEVEAAVEPAETVAKALAPKIDWSHLSIAVIDDATDLRRIIRAMLRGFGTSQIGDAANGLGFLNDPATQSTRYDVLLIDDDMAPVNGIELMYRIRTHADMPCHRSIAIMIAGDASVSTIRAALAAGFHGVVAKPFSANAIRLQVERFLNNPLPWEKDGHVWRPVHPKKAAAPRSEAKQGD